MASCACALSVPTSLLDDDVPANASNFFFCRGAHKSEAIMSYKHIRNAKYLLRHRHRVCMVLFLELLTQLINVCTQTTLDATEAHTVVPVSCRGRVQTHTARHICLTFCPQGLAFDVRCLSIALPSLLDSCFQHPTRKSTVSTAISSGFKQVRRILAGARTCASRVSLSTIIRAWSKRARHLAIS